MRRFLTTLMILLVVLVAGLSALVLLVNPNDFRDYMVKQVAEFQDVPLFPGVFFLPGNKKRVRRGVDVDISGTHPAFSSLWFSAPIIG